MNINLININFQNKINKQKNLTYNVSNPINKQSNIYFKGLKSDSFEKSNDVRIINDNDDFPVEEFLNFFDSKFNDFIKKMIAKQVNDVKLEQYARIILNRESTIKSSHVKDMDIGEFLDRVMPEEKDDFDKYVLKIANNNGASKVSQMFPFLNAVFNNDKVRKAFNGSYEESANIYVLLKNKDDIKNYPRFLLYLYDDYSKSDSDASEINQYCDFLRDNKITSLYLSDKSNKFAKRYFMLASRCNNFESYGDVADAIDYLKIVQPRKIELLNSVLSSHLDYSGSAEDFYKDYGTYVDYFYETSHGKNLDSINKYFNYILEYNSLNQNARKVVESVFNTETNKDESNSSQEDEYKNRIEFFEFLHKQNISLSLFSTYCANFIVQDGKDIKDIIQNKPAILKKSAPLISKEQNPELFYLNFAQVLNYLYEEDENHENHGRSVLSAGIKTIEYFDFKNQQEIIDLYNLIYKQKVKQIPKDKLVAFVDLLSFYSETSKNSVSHKDYNCLKKTLESRKTEYNRTISEIEKYRKANPDVLLGMSADTIYNKFIDKFRQSKNTIQVLSRVIQESKEDQNDKKSFRSLFYKEKDFVNFVSLNSVSFDFDEDSKDYRDACYKIIKTINSEYGNNSGDIISKLTQSGFFINSKNELNEFVNSAESSDALSNVLKIISDKEVDSLEKLYAFYNEYSSCGEMENISEFLMSKTEGYNLNDCIRLLDKIKTFISFYDLDATINNGNILSIDLPLIDEAQFAKELDGQKINTMLSSLLGDKDSKNCISLLDETYIPQNQKQKFSRFKIARELITKGDKVDSSFKDLLKALNFDREIVEQKANGKANETSVVAYLMNSMPDEFYNLVNDDLWEYKTQDGILYPNIYLHAKLKLIARFGLSYGVDKMYSKENREKLRKVVETIYSTTPDKISLMPKYRRFKLSYIDKTNDKETIDAIFNSHGNLVTIYPKAQY